MFFADQKDWSMPAAMFFANQEDKSMPAARADVFLSTGGLAAPDRKGRWGINWKSRWLFDPVVDADRKGRSRSGGLIDAGRKADDGYPTERSMPAERPMMVIQPSGRCRPEGR
jgi:hypothetical protein